MKNKIPTIKKRSDFETLMKKGKVISNGVFLLRFVNNPTQMRYAIATNKKIFRTAVLRNKIKRQIRTFLQNLNDLKKKDILIIVKNTYNKNSYEVNLQHFTSLYNTIK
jgi:ribonuclease P protein component